MKTLRNEIKLDTTIRSEQKEGVRVFFWARLDPNQKLFYFKINNQF